MSERPPPYAILGPCPCQECGTFVWWARGLTRDQGEIVKGTAWWRERSGRVHSHVPVKGLRRTLKPRSPKARNPYPMLANARAEWDNRQAGTSSTRVDSPTDAVALLVPGATASSRYKGRD